ncbi:DNA polymerase III subunit gamma/tau [Actinomyces oris]|uniref:DNA polymerase III subunit gamma/tau n=1 Tax=Actinomyces oris TaxID=544580 RepID=A0A1Q8WTW4_9ACTO|nr:DNA polymerase III subunit gamma/tau [Actinomyces oris]
MRAAAVSVQTVAVATGPQPSPVVPATAGSATAAGPTGASGYGLLPPQGAPQAPAEAPGGADRPVPDPSGPPILTASQHADQSSAVAAAGAVPADAVGAHRAAAVMASSTDSAAGTARTAAPADSDQEVDPAMQETMTIPTNPSAATAIPTATSWSSTAPSLQDSGRLPQARGA